MSTTKKSKLNYFFYSILYKNDSEMFFNIYRKYGIIVNTRKILSEKPVVCEFVNLIVTIYN